MEKTIVLSLIIINIILTFGFITIRDGIAIEDYAGENSIRCMRLCKRHNMKSIAHLPKDGIDCACAFKEAK